MDNLNIYFIKIFSGQLSWDEVFVCYKNQASDKLNEMIQDHYQDHDFYFFIEQKTIGQYFMKMKENQSFFIDYFIQKSDTPHHSCKHLKLSENFKNKLKQEKMNIIESVTLLENKNKASSIISIDEHFLIHAMTTIQKRVQQKKYHK